MNRSAVLPHALAGASLGGSGDRGLEFEPSVRASLTEKIRSAGIPLLSRETLPEAVGERMAVYGVDTSEKAVGAFVNIGGGSVDMGTDPWILELGPGLHRAIEVPETVQDRGVLLAMAERGIPVIHLLNMKGLTRTYGIPWDPVPFEGERPKPKGAVFWFVLVLYLCLMSVAHATADIGIRFCGNGGRGDLAPALPGKSTTFTTASEGTKHKSGTSIQL